MVPKSIIESGLDNGCKILYAFLDEVAGPKCDWDIPSFSEIARRTSQKPETISTHAKHLRDARIIELNRQGNKKYTVRVVHNPTRGIVNPSVMIPTAIEHARKKSKYAKTAEQTIPNAFQKSELGNLENREPLSSQRSPKIGGQSKSKKYEERYVWTEQWDSSYYQEGPKCIFQGCQELVRGHSFSDHEPVWPENHFDEEVTAEDVAKLILDSFPGTELLDEGNLL